MHPTELFMRQQADTAREQIRSERRSGKDRRQQDMREVRMEINVYLEQGMERTKAVNFVLDGNNIPILLKKEVRKSFKYGCYTISSIAAGLSDINRQNSLDLVVEAIQEPDTIHSQ